MLAYIKGSIIFNDLKSLIILTPQGIGYQVTITDPIQVGESIELFLSQIIREDAHTLYGFRDHSQKALFERLTTVSGVGPKSAYSLIATVGVQGICEAIIYDRQDVLKSAPGIGAKVAAKIILELQDKIKNISISQQIVKSSDSNSIFGEVVEACVGLGFKDKDVMQILKTNAQVQEVKNSSELLKIVLKELSK